MVVRYYASVASLIVMAMMAMTSISITNNSPNLSILTRMFNPVLMNNVGVNAFTKKKKMDRSLPLGVKVDRRDYGNDEVRALMEPKAHGTCVQEPPSEFRFDIDRNVASKINCFNRKYAERANSFSPNFFEKVKELSADGTKPVKFYDTMTGRHLFTVGGPHQKRNVDAFLKESKKHGWPSFRKPEVNWDNVRRTFLSPRLIFKSRGVE